MFSRLSRAAVGVVTAVTMSAGVLVSASPATAVESERLTTQQIMSVPVVAQWGNYIQNMANTSGYYARGIARKGQPSGEAYNYEELLVKKGLIRQAHGPDPTGMTQRVLIWNKDVTCARKGKNYSKPGSALISQDRKTTWTCEKGYEAAALVELAMLSPVGAVQIYDMAYPGEMTYTYEDLYASAPGEGLVIRAYRNGAPLWTADYTLSSIGGKDGSYYMQYKDAAGKRTITYEVKPGLNGNTITPISKLKKKWGNAYNNA